MVVESTTQQDDDLLRRVRHNQRLLASQIKADYDFVVCGAGSSGCVIARRLAENPEISVLLLEAGATDELPSVTDAELWQTNLGGATDWAFQTEPNAHLGGRALTLSMGKVLGGGSSINVMAWSRGHKSDWDSFATESANSAWSYESVIDIYRRVRRLARCGRSAAPRHRRTGLRSARRRPVPVRQRDPRSRHSPGRSALRRPQWSDDGAAVRCRTRRVHDPRRHPAIGFSLLHLPLHGSTQSDRPNRGHSAARDHRRQTC